MMAIFTSKKYVVVDDPGVRKTCLILSYATDDFLTEYVLTISENHIVTRMVDNEPFNINIFDSPSHGGYERLRTLSYSLVDVFLVSFSVDLLVSFRNVRSSCVPEINHHCPGTPFLLVGTQVDTRDKPSSREKLSKIEMAVIKREDGEKMAMDLDPVGYLECSALTRFKPVDVFDKAITQP